jgi:hypothetical protein
MQIDTEHLHYWMQAIRQSKDPMRTMDAFWSGQLKSKEWLIDALEMAVHPKVDCTMPLPFSIDIHGGWVGVLASMLFQSRIPVKQIRSIDIDSTCEAIATMMNKGEEIKGKFRAVTSDMCTIRSDADIVINTSCEHITQDQYDLWLSGMPYNSLLVLQSNNYDIPEHVRISGSLEEFKNQCNINVLWSGELDLPLYKRFMLIGYNNV